MKVNHCRGCRGSLYSLPCQPNSDPPKKWIQGPLVVIRKKSYVMLHLEAAWPSKENILSVEIILAEPGP